MHGLETIRKINKDPSSYRGEFLGGKRTGGPDFPDLSGPTEIGHRTLADRSAEHAAAGFTPGVQDRIESAIDLATNSPLMKFWRKLNDERGEEVGYAEAKLAFNGGLTPEGAISFVEFGEGLRAIIAPAIGGKRSYHGEYRERTENGTVWHKVCNTAGLPIAFQYPDFALIAARRERNEKIEKAFR